MKIHEALREIVRQFGKSVVQEKRMMFLLADYQAFDDYPAVKQVFRAIAEDGIARELYARSMSSGQAGYLRFAEDVKKHLVTVKHFRQEYACYAVDCVSYALGIISSVTEPSDHGYDPTERGGSSNRGGTGNPGKPAPGGNGGPHQPNNGGQGRPAPGGSGGAPQPGSGRPGRSIRNDNPWLVPDWNFAMTSSPLKWLWCVILCCGWLALGGLIVYIIYIIYKVTGVQVRGGGVGYASGKLAKGVLCLILGGFFYASDSIGTLAEKIIARQGKVWAMMNLGNRYLTGNGAEQNYAEAAKWYLQAAVQGNADAQYFIGMMYRDGLGVSRSFPDAVKWTGKAAASGKADAEYDLGLMYGAGIGVGQDPAESARWFGSAVRKYQSDAAGGSARAAFILGSMYESGTGTAQDCAEAAGWFLKSGMQGEKAAEYILGVMYESGSGVARDITEAKKWYRMAAKAYKKAAKAGIATAQTGLGVMYEKGQGVWQSWRSAAKWYKKAAEQGNDDARQRLDALRRAGRI